MLTLEQALEISKMDRRKIKRWYAQGYYMRDDGLWYSFVGGKEYPRYQTW